MDDFIEDTITPIIDTKKLEKKTFKPWHKPRKQWCRFQQWVAGQNWVIDSIGSESLISFNYLGLPGDDLLDLRLLANTCKDKSVKLKYLGFNSVDEKSSSTNELLLSESELDKTGVIVPGSKIITETLESLSRKESSAYIDATTHHGCFHMINFDLCKSIAQRGGDYSGDTYFTALKNLLEQQMNYMREPWVLFITTNVCKDSVIDSAMLQLLAAIKGNNDEHPDFSIHLEEQLCINAEQVTDAITDLSHLSDQKFFDAFAIGFSKWLLKICLSISSAWSIEMTPSCKYRTGNIDGNPDMLSLAFRFEYIHQQAIDAYDLTNNVNMPKSKTELEFALAMITQVSEIFNLDCKINQDPSLLDSLTEHTAELLVNARYEKEEYLQWVTDGCPSEI